MSVKAATAARFTNISSRQDRTQHRPEDRSRLARSLSPGGRSFVYENDTLNTDGSSDAEREVRTRQQGGRVHLQDEAKSSLFSQKNRLQQFTRGNSGLREPLDTWGVGSVHQRESEINIKDNRRETLSWRASDPGAERGGAQDRKAKQGIAGGDTHTIETMSMKRPSSAHGGGGASRASLSSASHSQMTQQGMRLLHFQRHLYMVLMYP